MGYEPRQVGPRTQFQDLCHHEIVPPGSSYPTPMANGVNKKLYMKNAIHLFVKEIKNISHVN